MMGKHFKRLAVFLVLITVLFPGLILAESPVSKERLEACVRGYINQFSSKKVVKYEVTDSGSYYKVERDFDTYLLYSHLCHIYWEGAYGQIIRDPLYVDLLKIDGQWVVDRVYPNLDQSAMIQEPTKSLPVIPEAPAKESLIKTLEKALPELEFRSEYKYTITTLNLSDPTFEWRGIDYEYGAYVYTGDIQFTMKNQVYRKPKQIWKGNCKVLMLYNVQANKWETGFEWVGRATQVE